MSVYIDDFLFVVNSMKFLDEVKKLLTNEYNMKDLREVKMITKWQVTRDMVADTIKIVQSAFIRYLVIEERLTDYNANVIPMKAGSAIEMPDPEDYNETDLQKYQ